MNSNKIILSDLTNPLPDTIKELLGTNRLFLFYGEQGNGKTTLIRKILLEVYGGASDFCSPTYSLLNEYDTPKGRVYHMDWYRLRHPAELEEAGIREVLEDENSHCFVEWPQIGSYFWKDLSYVAFYLSRNENQLTIEFEIHAVA